VRGGSLATLAAVPRPAPVAMPLVIIAGVRIWTPMPAGDGARVVAMPPPANDPSAMTVTPTALPYQIGPLPVVSYRVMPRR
jgi:hypothetical protein